jgi:NAD(P)H-flavin reductase
LANRPNWDGRLEFLIRLQANGAFSTYLGERARVGDPLIVRGPLGNFVLDETSPRSRCLIGGGCGTAPVLSMLRHLADFGDTQPTHLIFGATHEDELFSADEIAALREALPQLGVTLSVWRPGPAWTGFSGTPAEAFSAYLRSAIEAPDVYVCGPPKQLDAITQVARKHAIPAVQTIAERVFQT